MAYRTNDTSFAPGKSGNPNGRPKGTISYRDLLTAEERAELANAAGCTPLQFLISVMLDKEGAPLFTRLDAAKAAAPYMHRKMPIAVELPNQPTQVDVAKLLALPRAEREALLSTLTKLGINLGVGAPQVTGAMPVIDKAVAGAIAARYTTRGPDAPLPPSDAAKKATQNARVAAALAKTGAVNARGEAVAPRKTMVPTKKVVK